MKGTFINSGADRAAGTKCCAAHNETRLRLR